MTPPLADQNVLVPIDEPMDTEEANAKGELAKETEEVVKVSSTTISPKPLPIHVVEQQVHRQRVM